MSSALTNHEEFGTVEKRPEQVLGAGRAIRRDGLPGDLRFRRVGRRASVAR